MPDFSHPKFVLIALLFAALVLVKFLAGNRPYAPVVRRARRFGRKGSRSPLRNPEAYLPPPDAPPADPEEEFFQERH